MIEQQHLIGKDLTDLKYYFYKLIKLYLHLFKFSNIWSLLEFLLAWQGTFMAIWEGLVQGKQ